MGALLCDRQRGGEGAVFLGLTEGFSSDERRAPAPRVALTVAALLLIALAGPGAFGVALGLSLRANVGHDYPAFALGIVWIAVLVALLPGSASAVRAAQRERDRLLDRGFGLIVPAIAAEMVLYADVLDLRTRELSRSRR